MAPLDRVLQETLDECRRMSAAGEPVTARGITLPSWLRSPSTANARLEALVRLGLLRRVGRRGRRVVYEVTGA